MTVQITYILILLGIFAGQITSGQTTLYTDTLVLFTDTVTYESGYKNQNGDTIIPAGKYSICCTDTFRTYAIVAIQHKGIVAIDRHENVLYDVFPYDNGPDYVSDGLFRILMAGKIGYADSVTGKIIIEPHFDCAWPFVNGAAKVSTDCKTQSDGEHSIWLSDSWYYIDKTGKKTHQTKKK